MIYSKDMQMVFLKNRSLDFLNRMKDRNLIQRLELFKVQKQVFVYLGKLKASENIMRSSYLFIL